MSIFNGNLCHSLEEAFEADVVNDFLESATNKLQEPPKNFVEQAVSDVNNSFITATVIARSQPDTYTDEFVKSLAPHRELALFEMLKVFGKNFTERIVDGTIYQHNVNNRLTTLNVHIRGRQISTRSYTLYIVRKRGTVEVEHVTKAMQLAYGKKMVFIDMVGEDFVVDGFDWRDNYCFYVPEEDMATMASVDFKDFVVHFLGDRKNA